MDNRENNTNNLVAEDTLGTWLKKNREEVGISLVELSNATKIRIRQITYLENDNYELLPDKVYLTGFVKSIAEELKIDANIGIKLIEKSYCGKRSSIKELKKDQEIILYTISKLFKKRILVSSIGVCTILVLLFVIQVKTHRGFYRNTRAISSNSNISIKYEKKVIAIKKIAPVITKSIKLVVKAKYGDSWIAYKSDKAAVIKFVLKKEQAISINGDLIRIVLGNYKALEIVQNNKIVSIKKTSLGTTAHLVFPEELQVQFKAPLFVFKNDGTAKARQHLERVKEI